MRLPLVFFLGALAVACGLATSCRPAPPASSAPLRSSAYVWQRVHSPAVAAAVTAHAPDFSRLVVLAAEIDWRGDTPVITRINLDYSTLATVPSLGLALRIRGYHGSFLADAPAAQSILTLARSLLDDARAVGLAPAELQLDFDAGERQLGGYRQWLQTVRDAHLGTALTFTALPAWLAQLDDFSALAHSADGFVLQVHSLSRPGSAQGDLPPLCDPVAARRAVLRAARVNVPFRVALPTYGYAVATTPDGKFVGLSAEGPAPDWPANVVVRELRADPTALAALVADWTTRHPASLTGIIWYRLPVAGDQRNWRWPTLRAVMAGRAPLAQLSLETHFSADGLLELSATNTGDDDFAAPVHATLAWTGAQRLAADALPPAHLAHETPASLVWQAPALALAPGERRSLGWVRFSSPPTSVHVSSRP
ncbi:DUF3142 domain-containing protein [Horticoccus luteus]|uniref:DUF3142 domain-containing protein n=1 Tax=Horticoccus luteus TaxID=2862869 RepID=A0A8F9TYT5_9BACT|nr:DUF3142 domain-containing protein [Horticoccus luteus]QYM80027.1 DUF3142 domain-containing protein [Horticoccus luteus]